MVSAMTLSLDMAERFRGFLPVVVDIETGGFDPLNNAILEIAMVLVAFDDEDLTPVQRWQRAVTPYEGSLIEPAALKVTGIDPADPERDAVSETAALQDMFSEIRKAMKTSGCQRAILVAHNAAFDQQFLHAAVNRNQLKRDPFHPFSFIDTASLAAVAYGHTVLSEACARAEIPFDTSQAHSALYDAERTAELFCAVVNRWRALTAKTSE